MSSGNETRATETSCWKTSPRGSRRMGDTSRSCPTGGSPDMTTPTRAPARAARRRGGVPLRRPTGKRLVCASCNPSGARPHGLYDNKTSAGDEHIVDVPGIWAGRWLAANIPGGPRWKSTPRCIRRATSPMKGVCSSTAPTHSPRRTRTPARTSTSTSQPASAAAPARRDALALISSGESTDESAFLDASENGGDVFFLTKSNLVSQDLDQAYDVYDAHDCSESPCITPATQPTPCSSSSTCQGNSTSSTNFATPASSTNAGNALTTPGPAPKGQPLGKKEVRADPRAAARQSSEEL